MGRCRHSSGSLGLAPFVKRALQAMGTILGAEFCTVQNGGSESFSGTKGSNCALSAQLFASYHCAIFFPCFYSSLDMSQKDPCQKHACEIQKCLQGRLRRLMFLCSVSVLVCCLPLFKEAKQKNESLPVPSRGGFQDHCFIEKGKTCLAKLMTHGKDSFARYDPNPYCFATFLSVLTKDTTLLWLLECPVPGDFNQ